MNKSTFFCLTIVYYLTKENRTDSIILLLTLPILLQSVISQVCYIWYKSITGTYCDVYALSDDRNLGTRFNSILEDSTCLLSQENYLTCRMKQQFFHYQ